jgi:hypothetical protein
MGFGVLRLYTKQSLSIWTITGGFALQQAMKAQKGSTGIDLLFL